MEPMPWLPPDRKPATVLVTVLGITATSRLCSASASSSDAKVTPASTTTLSASMSLMPVSRVVSSTMPGAMGTDWP